MDDPLNDSFFFEHHPDAMWIYDLESLAFLQVNDSALTRYGYSRDEFLAMTIQDIRPKEDIPALLVNVGEAPHGLDRAGIWRHLTKSGEIISVEITSHTLTYQGKKAKLVSARDVTKLVALEHERALLTAQEKKQRQQAEAAARRFRSIFEKAPEKMLVLSPGDLTIIAVSDTYLRATLTIREAILGKNIFEVFPDNPNERNADGTRNLRASLQYVMTSKALDVMPLQRYPIPRPAELGGGFEERYWSVVNTPVMGDDDQIAYIIHRADDVTEIMQHHPEGNAAPDTLEKTDSQLLLNILARSQELKTLNDRLREQEANLSTAQRLVGLGIWKLDINASRLSWSDSVFAIYGISPKNFTGKLDDYVSLVHPDDRDEYLSKYHAYIKSPSDHFSFAHRVIRLDGTIIHIRGIGELTISDDKPMLSGVVQDISADVEAANRLAAAIQLERIAGQCARLGGWRADLITGRLQWSDETAAIHEVDDNAPRSLHDGIGFYHPDDRERIHSAFSACAEQGVAFDEVLKLTTAKGRDIWVRSIGHPEYQDDGSIGAVYGAFQDITDIVETRQKSELLSRQLHQVLEQTSDAVLMLDRQFHITYLNPQAEQLLRAALINVKGKSVLTVFDPLSAAPFMAQYENAMTTGRRAHFTEYFGPLAIWVSIDAYPIPEGLAIYFRDVTLEHHRSQQLRLLESAIAQQNDILIITEADSIEAPNAPRIVYINDALTRITGFTRDEVINQTPRIFQGPKTQRAVLDQIRSALQKKQGIRTELINYTKCGKELHLEIDITPLPNQQGEVTHFVAVERDNTEKRHIEQESRTNEERFHLLAKATNDVIRDWDIVHDTLWWNESFEHVFGYRRHQVQPGNGSWSDRIHPDDKASVLASINQAIASSDDQWQAEYRFMRADGSVATVMDREFVMRDTHGKAVRMVGSMVDVTEDRKLAEQLRQAQKLEAVGHLTGGIAHDFNNLLTVILGNTELLKEHLADQHPLRSLAELTANAAQKGAELTSRLLAFARRQALEPRLLDIQRLVSEMNSLLRRTLSEDIELMLRNSGELCSVEVDQSQMEAALLNLAINARDAMPNGGRLTLETRPVVLSPHDTHEHPDLKPGAYVLLSVSDTGHGMDSETIERAFEPFFTTKPVGKGSGLGLSMVYGFVKQSGGHIQIESKLGMGTTVKLYLPCVSNPKSASDSPTPATALHRGHEHLLVVEDDDLVRMYVITLLTDLGYRISSARSGHEALEILKTTPDIDLLFTDVIMPGGLNGKQLAEAALALRPGLKVLFTSGYPESTIVHDGRLDRGVLLLNKPYRRQDLASKVRMALEAS